MKEVRTSAYVLEMPDDWETTTEAGLTQIFHPDGVGAVTISSYSAPGATPDAEHELRKFAQQDIAIQTESRDGQNLVLAEYERNENDGSVFTLAMAISRSGNFLLASYHCKVGDKRAGELSVVRRIFDSVVLT